MDIQVGDIYQTKRMDHKYRLTVLAKGGKWLMIQEQSTTEGEGYPLVYLNDDFIEIFVDACGYAKSN